MKSAESAGGIRKVPDRPRSTDRAGDSLVSAEDLGSSRKIEF